MKTPVHNRPRLLGIICLAALCLSASLSLAASVTYSINANGIKEVNSGGVSNGDPNGSAIGTILLDNGTGSGTTGFATINLSLTNIDPTLSAHHIHEGPPTTTGPVRLDFGNPNTILTGTSASGTLSGTILNLDAVVIGNIFANPTAFYYNLHSTPTFPGGAVRDQLIPEPGTCALLTGGAFALVLLRRRSKTS
jgi:hypothetical protein